MVRTRTDVDAVKTGSSVAYIPQVAREVLYELSVERSGELDSFIVSVYSGDAVVFTAPASVNEVFSGA